MSLDLWALTQDRVGAKVAEARAVATSGRPLMAGWLEQAAAWIGEVTPTWEQLTGSVPLQRTYRRLAASSHLEAWLICWPTDGHLQLHDHGGASGAFQVIEGELNERALVAGSASDTGLGATGVVLRDRLLPPGEVVAFDGFYIHDVYNLRPQAVTSVHIYGPAWRPMSFYRLEGGVVRTVGHGSRDGLGEAGPVRPRSSPPPDGRPADRGGIASGRRPAGRLGPRPRIRPRRIRPRPRSSPPPASDGGWRPARRIFLKANEVAP
jgi:hypothetical protein